MRLIPWPAARPTERLEPSGVRRMDVRRDLIGVTELIGLAFADELRSAGRNPQEEIWMVRRSMPFVWLLATISPRFRDAFIGFVWTEGGCVVGNVSLTRLDRAGRQWMIGNVAVHPDLRQRGIARRLTARAIEFCRDQGAVRVSLEVRRGNYPAQHLYETIGFRRVDSHTKFELTSVPNVSPAVVIGGTVRSIQPRDYRQLRRLRFASERGAASVAAATADASLLDWWEYLIDVLNGSAGASWVAERDREVLGYVSVTSGPGAIRRLRFHVHPMGRGLVEAALVSTALYELRSRRIIVRAEVQSDYEDLVAALQAYGFTPIETLDRMTLELQPET